MVEARVLKMAKVKNIPGWRYRLVLFVLCVSVFMLRQEIDLLSLQEEQLELCFSSHSSLLVLDNKIDDILKNLASCKPNLCKDLCGYGCLLHTFLLI